MLDIDHFKRVNDTYGHNAGDAVLREVAAVLRESTAQRRPRVARYGGEEFIAAAPPIAAPDHATARRERIRAQPQRPAHLAAAGNPAPARSLRVSAAAWASPSPIPDAPALSLRSSPPPTSVSTSPRTSGRNRVAFRVDPSCPEGSVDVGKAITPRSKAL